jgi:hypothetical protein
LLIATFGISMAPPPVLAEVEIVAAPYERPLAFGKAAHMTLKYTMFAGAVALALALTPAAFARGGGGAGGKHGGGFAGGMHVGGFAGGFRGGQVYGRGYGRFGYGLDMPYYPAIPAYCSEYLYDYNPAEGCYYWNG